MQKAPDIDETSREDLAPAERVLALAEDKARAVASSATAGEPRLILAADTLVAVPTPRGEEVLGKPDGDEDAGNMIRLLAGRDHLVHTGLALLDRLSGALYAARSDSLVRFAPMDEEEIEVYIGSGEWKDVAGAYRAQGLAAYHIERIEGSWSGIVGLPIRELYGILRRAGYRPRP